MFDFSGLGDQVARDVDADDLGAAPRQFAGDAPVPAGDVQDAQAGHRPEQVEQGPGGGIGDGIEAADIEIRDRVVPGSGHAAYASPTRRTSCRHNGSNCASDVDS
jgi:hypothetical protein